MCIKQYVPKELRRDPSNRRLVTVILAATFVYRLTDVTLKRLLQYYTFVILKKTFEIEFQNISKGKVLFISSSPLLLTQRVLATATIQ